METGIQEQEIHVGCVTGRQLRQHRILHRQRHHHPAWRELLRPLHDRRRISVVQLIRMLSDELLVPFPQFIWQRFCGSGPLGADTGIAE